MLRRPAFSRFFPPLSLATLLFLSASRDLKAQATATASREAAFSAFGAYSRVWTEYGSQVDNGASFGVDYTRYVHWFVTPSIEARGKVTSGGLVDENTWGGGIRFERRIQNFHPYADFLVSKGTIHFNFGTPHTSDASVVYSPGLGLDYNLTPRWSAIVDYQFEFWNLGYGQTFTPQALSFGVRYRIPL